MNTALARRGGAVLLALAAAAAATLVVAPPAEAANTTYYVDCSAAAAGSGTQASPWNALAPVAAKTFGSGDQILLRRGTQCTGRLAPKGSGAAGSPIRIDAYGTGAKPRVAGNGTVSEAVLLSNQQYVEISNLDVSNKGASAALRRGVYVTIADYGVAHGIVLRGLSVHDVNGNNVKDVAGSAGILVDARGSTTPSSYDGLTIDGNDVSAVDRTGINTASSWMCRTSVKLCNSPGGAWTPFRNVVVKNNTVTNVGGDGIVVQNSDGARVEYNVVRQAAQRDPGNNAGLWPWNSDNSTFQFNEVSETRRAPGTGDGNGLDIDFGTNKTVFQYNYTHANQGGMILFCGCYGVATNAVVRYNISQNDGSRIIRGAGAQGSGNAFYNNTVYLPASSSTAIFEGGADTTLLIANNIFYNLGSGGYDTSNTGGQSWRNNVFFGKHPSSEPSDPAKITADPRLAGAGSGGSGLGSVSGYQLTAGSPAIRTGMTIAGSGGRDFFGTAVPSGCRPDIGADQRSAGCTG